jgi:hypothetical protein
MACEAIGARLKRSAPRSAAGDQYPTWDVTSRYGGSGGELYSGLISPGGFTILINRAPNAVTQQVNIASVSGDQPFLEATTSLGEDRLYVGYNQNSTDSTVDVFLDANAPSPTFASIGLDVRNPSDMPPTRTAIHSSGTIYCAFYSNNSDGTCDVVVVKDLEWGGSSPPFQALVDGGDGQFGVRVAFSISNPWPGSDFLDPTFGNDRYGPDLALAVDHHNDQRVYILRHRNRVRRRRAASTLVGRRRPELVPRRPNDLCCEESEYRNQLARHGRFRVSAGRRRQLGNRIRDKR